MVLDSDLTNYKDLAESVVEKYLPSYLEVSHVQCYDEVLKTFLEITSNRELITMLKLHCKSKVIIIFNLLHILVLLMLMSQSISVILMMKGILSTTQS